MMSENLHGKHTPAPWVAASKPSSVAGWPVCGELGTLIADVCSMSFQDQPIPKEAFANAKLIAAAPDMLATLQLWEAYDDLDEADFAQVGPMLLYARALDATRAAIAKATS
jgi:hypothetical protein